MTNSAQNPDSPNNGNARQYLGYHKLFSDPAYCAFMSDADRTFRRTSQSHRTILQASRLAHR